MMWDGVVVFGTAEPGVCATFGLVGVGDRGDLGDIFEELSRPSAPRTVLVYLGWGHTRSRLSGEAQLERGAMTYIGKMALGWGIFCVGKRDSDTN
jgi:hypothetical protein